MNKDQVEGRLDQAKGTLKKTVGKLVGNESLQVEGQVDQTSGQLQAKVGDIREAVQKKAQKLVDKL